MSIEKDSGLHSKERYDVKGKTTAEKYANAHKLSESDAVANDKVIDINKTGKVIDITSKEFKREVKYLNE